jgi:hypothetical protein
MQVGHREKSYSEREKKLVELAFRQADILLLVGEACEVERCLLLAHRASDEFLHRCLALRSILRGFACFHVFGNTTTVGNVSCGRDDGIRQVHVPLDLADEVKDDSLLGDTEHLRIEVLRIVGAKDVVTLAISVVVRIVNDIDQAVVAHATRKGRLDDLGVLALPDFACDPGDRRGVGHLNIIRSIKIILIKLTTAKIMLNVTRTPPRVSLRCFEADVWRVSEGRIKAVQMPVLVTKVALQHLALVATRDTTLRAQYRLLISIKHPRVVRSLVAIAAVLCTVSR